MGEIINFDNSINKNNSKVNKILLDTIKKIKYYKKNYFEEDKDYEELDYLDKYISNIELKSRTKNWRIEPTEEKFIKNYEYFKNNMLDDPYWIDLFLINLVYLSDLDSAILNEDHNYIDLIVTGMICSFNDIDIKNTKVIKKILKDIKKPIIKDKFSLTNKYDQQNINDMIYGLSLGYNVLTVSTWYIKEDINEEIDDLLDKPLTYDRIKEFYLDQEDLRYIAECDLNKNLESDLMKHKKNQKIIDSIGNIELFDNEYQEIYLKLVRKIIQMRNVDIEIDNLVRLTGLYLEMGAQITEFDMEDIEHYLEIGGKNENRRL